MLRRPYVPRPLPGPPGRALLQARCRWTALRSYGKGSDFVSLWFQERRQWLLSLLSWEPPTCEWKPRHLPGPVPAELLALAAPQDGGPLTRHQGPPVGARSPGSSDRTAKRVVSSSFLCITRVCG